MIIQHPAFLDLDLNTELLQIAQDLGIEAKTGKTMCTYDFYEGNKSCYALISYYKSMI